MDEFDGDFAAGDQSLREAIHRANSTAGHNDIPFDSSLLGGPAAISLTLGELAISDSLTIDWPGTNLLQIDAGGASRIFNIDNGTSGLIDVMLSQLSLTGGSTTDNGGAIRSIENLSIRQLAVSGNHADGLGGGIAHFFGRLDVVESVIDNNSAGNEGGGIWSNTDLAEPQIATITNSTISGNSAGAWRRHPQL